MMMREQLTSIAVCVIILCSFCYHVTLSFGVNVRENRMTSRMDNSDTLGTLGTDDTGRRQTKHKNTT